MSAINTELVTKLAAELCNMLRIPTQFQKSQQIHTITINPDGSGDIDISYTRIERVDHATAKVHREELPKVRYGGVDEETPEYVEKGRE
jgi:hypothetical protein